MAIYRAMGLHGIRLPAKVCSSSDFDFLNNDRPLHRLSNQLSVSDTIRQKKTNLNERVRTTETVFLHHVGRQNHSR
jgi:hypothetical protein